MAKSLTVDWFILCRIHVPFPSYTVIFPNPVTSSDQFPASPAACSCDSPWCALARSAAGPAHCRCPPHGTLAPPHLERDWPLAAPPGPPPHVAGGSGASNARGPGQSWSPARSPVPTRSRRGPGQWPLTDRGAAYRRANSALWRARLYP